MVKFGCAALSALLCLATTTSAAAAGDAKRVPSESESVPLKEEERPDPIEQCGLFIAESSIPNAGWGLYIGWDVPDGEIMYPTTLALNGVDVKQHMNIRTQILGQPQLPEWKMNDYVWSSESMDAALDAQVGQATIAGIGGLVNMRSGLINSMIQKPKDISGVGHDGASTQFHNQYFTAIGDVEAGHELFASYGEQWFIGRSKIFGDDLPLSADYKNADYFVTMFEHITSGGLEPFSEDLWDLVKNALGPEVLSPRTVKAMPQTSEDAVLRTKNRNTTAYDGMYPVVKSHKWLEENGLCMDHIEPKPSLIPRAGMGAFAKLFIPKGKVVTGAPVVPLSKHHFEMYYADASSTVLWKGQQLMLNYAIGNPKTSLVFYPNAAVINYINHDGKAPNAKLRWSDHPMSENGKRHIKYADMTPLELLKNVKTFLMEVVAIRDIEPGEEVVLDYGQNWQKAWDNHKHPPQEELDQYRSAHITMKEQEHFLTEVDDPESPYAAHIQTRCYIDYDPSQVSSKNVGGGTQYKVYQWREHTFGGVPMSKVCRLRKRAESSSGKRYTVMVEEKPGAKNWVIVTNVAERALLLVDKPYTKPQFRRDSFRHVIEVDDDMIPEVWRDVDMSEPECSLYMADSPTGGFNVYTTEAIGTTKPISESEEITILLEDVQENMKLGDKYHKDKLSEQLPWHLSDFNWDPSLTKSSGEAKITASVIPGLGMLAKPDMGMGANAVLGAPIQTNLFHRRTDPSAGASSSGQIKFSASQDLPVGGEIVMRYVGNAMSPRVNSPIPTTPKTKSVAWLKDTAQCLDNIRPGVSSNKQAGYGAFATRSLSSGDVIAPMPVVPMHRRQLEIYEAGGWRPKLVGQQQLLNYVYGHPKANLLFFPYSPVVNYINHDSKKANAKLAWSKKTRDSDALMSAPPQLLNARDANLVMELVATRDIGRDEEILIDYGSEWESSWDKHVENWKPTGPFDYVPASAQNDLLVWGNETGRLTKDEVDKMDTFLMCHVGQLNEDDQLDAGMYGPEWQWQFSSDIFSMRNARYCDIVKRNEPEDAATRKNSVSPVLLTYDVIVYDNENRKNAKVVKGVPRRGLTYMNSPYRSDTFLRNAFRHEIGLPDDMVPKPWRVR